jgi:hypothetical protein
MIPLNRDYYIKNIDSYGNDIFICYRKASIDQIAMCYCLATNQTWSRVFNIKNLNEIIEKIKQLSLGYQDNKHHISWYTDQIYLTTCIRNYKKYVILNDDKQGYKRLDQNFDIDNFFKIYSEDLKNNKYSDYHIQHDNSNKFLIFLCKLLNL